MALLAEANTVAVSHDQRTPLRGCLSIADVNDRVDCLETGVVPGATASNPTQRSGESPTFDCRAASTVIDRTICNDATLSALDARMGRAFQQALQAAADRLSLIENQHLWLAQRDQGCGSLAYSVIVSCLLEATRARTAVLSRNIISAPEASTSNQLPRPVGPSSSLKSYAEFQPNSLTRESIQPSTRPTPSKSQSDNSDSTFGLIAISAIAGFLLFAGTHRYFAHRRRQLEEQARRDEERARVEAEVQRLIYLYGEDVAARILSHQVWQGMTEEQLLESRGSPADVGREIIRERTRETWKYQQIGKNRFRERIYLENGIVIGWKT